MFGLGNLQLKLTVELILFLFVVSSIIWTIVIHHFWSQINKSLFNILDYFLAIVVKLSWIEIIDRFLNHTRIRTRGISLVSVLLIIIVVRVLLRKLSIRVKLLTLWPFSFVILNISLLFFNFVHDHCLQLDNLVLRFLIGCFGNEISHHQIAFGDFFYFQETVQKASDLNHSCFQELVLERIHVFLSWKLWHVF